MKNNDELEQAICDLEMYKSSKFHAISHKSVVVLLEHLTRPQPCADAMNTLHKLKTLKALWDIEFPNDKRATKSFQEIEAALTQPKADVEGLKDMIGEATSIFEHIVDDLRDNQDLSHKDFRIKVSEMAHDYLSQNHIRHLSAQGYIGGGWQDISTIPDNLMSGVDLWDDREEKRYINCTFDLRIQAWADENSDFVKIPTHWMPLPAAPKKEV